MPSKSFSFTSAKLQWVVIISTLIIGFVNMIGNKNLYWLSENNEGKILPLAVTTHNQENQNNEALLLTSSSSSYKSCILSEQDKFQRSKDVSYSVSIPAKTTKKLSKLQGLEAGLARALSGIRNAARNQTSHEEDKIPFIGMLELLKNGEYV
ncbi:hypothetical protein MKX01_002889 [Papaver californicum]|nr:hypothetical protein MKX01_002889 [Papaver californicum]